MSRNNYEGNEEFALDELEALSQLWEDEEDIFRLLASSEPDDVLVNSLENLEISDSNIKIAWAQDICHVKNNAINCDTEKGYLKRFVKIAIAVRKSGYLFDILQELNDKLHQKQISMPSLPHYIRWDSLYSMMVWFKNNRELLLGAFASFKDLPLLGPKT